MESGTGHRHISGSSSRQSLHIDWDCMIKDILKQWWVVLLAALTAAFLAGVWQQIRYTPQYRAETTFVIGRSGYSYNIISANLQQAETTTKQYSQVVESSILQKQVCEELGMDSFDAAVRVETVPSSNLMKLSVTAGSPRQAYLISQSISDHAVELMGYFMDNVTMQVLQEAVIPMAPSNTLNMGSGMKKAALAGLLVMIGILAILSYYKDTIKNPDDITQKVDARLLGTIPFEKKNKSIASKLERKKVSLLLNNPMLSFAYVESYRMLATRVCLAMERSQKKILMVTSVSENEGKSTVAANIAVAMAQEGRRVLLVDCDFRKPAQYKIFEMDDLEHKDFCEAIIRKGGIRMGSSEEFPGLYMLFSKKPKTRPWDEESFSYMKRFLNFIKKKVDFIILDTSPMAFVSDTEEYAALADASLLIVKQDLMETCYINDAVYNLEKAGTTLIGCVLNGMHRGIITKTREYGRYSGYYGKYSHYSKVQDRD